MSFTETLAALAAEELLRARLVRMVAVANPAAGADWITTVPGGVFWELIAVHSRFVASAVVATRLARIQVRDDIQNTFLDYPSGFNITASQNVPITFAQGEGAVVQGASVGAPLPSPPVPLYGGLTVRSVTTSIDVGDQYSEVFLFVREWSEDVVLEICLEIGLHFEQLLDRSNRVPASWRD